MGRRRQAGSEPLQAAHVALLKVSKDGDRSRIEEVKILAGKPRAQLAAGDVGLNSMNAFRMQQMQGAANTRQMSEPFPEPGQTRGYGQMPISPQMQMPIAMQQPQMQMPITIQQPQMQPPMQMY